MVERVSERRCLPLGSVPPGAGLAVRLAGVAVRSVPDAELLELLSAEARQLAHQQARVWAVMAELATRNPLPNLPWTAEQVFDSAVEEVRAELRLTRRGAAAEVQRAVRVQAVSPVARALAAGRIDRARAVVLAEACTDLTGAQQAKLLAAVLPGADRLTCTGLAARVRRVAMALDPEWAERRYQEAIRARRVISYLNEDGSATISGQGLPADQAALACARVNAMAQAAKRAGAHAPIDQLRAELFLGLLDGRFEEMNRAAIVDALVRTFPGPDSEVPEKAADGAREEATVPARESATGRARESATEPAQESATESAAMAAPDLAAGSAAETAASRVGMELRVELSTLLGLDEHPGEIAGWGAVPAPVARKLAETQRHGEWRFAITDDQGRLLFDGITRHRPSDVTANDPPNRGPRAAGRGAGKDAADPRGAGGIVELQIPARLLTDPELTNRFPAWRRLLADLTRQSSHPACDRTGPGGPVPRAAAAPAQPDPAPHLLVPRLPPACCTGRSGPPARARPWRLDDGGQPGPGVPARPPAQDHRRLAPDQARRGRLPVDQPAGPQAPRRGRPDHLPAARPAAAVAGSASTAVADARQSPGGRASATLR
jgi:hypothetical protein